MYTSGAVAKSMIPVIHSAAKPVVVVVMGERLIQEAVEYLRAARVPEYRFPERAAAALAALTARSEALYFAQAEPILVKSVDYQEVSDILQSIGNFEGFLSSEICYQILDCYGIPTATMKLNKNVDEAVEWSHQNGYPVALKIASVDIVHKSDVGGVFLNLEDDSALRSAWDAIFQQVAVAQPNARIEGMHIQKMIPAGQEVIVGTIRDEQFGPLVMFGSGGIDVEGLKDVAFALAPLTQPEAEHLLNITWAGKKLAGFRNLGPADRQSVLDILYRLGQLAIDFPQLTEIEINPLRVMPDGHGSVAVDVRIKMAGV
jgi:acetyltransferase